MGVSVPLGAAAISAAGRSTGTALAAGPPTLLSSPPARQVSTVPGTGARRVLHAPIPSHCIGAGRSPCSPLAPQVQLARLCQAAILSCGSAPATRPLVGSGRPDHSWLRLNNAPGAPPHASGHSWRSPGSQDVYAKIRGRRELRFTLAAPSASGHAAHNLGQDL
ncbi:hypothetical protein NDU88_004285 [Pleurodeles waltl]|uniref:Uncharacterized protein n=1 Tax=Pleurodeles waltl TaxID=8319 RepID=A0AAV7M5Y2_PLEWA|nr:hypothetical protein NDU88_004285 [Pleurodeles waltl]